MSKMQAIIEVALIAVPALLICLIDWWRTDKVD